MPVLDVIAHCCLVCSISFHFTHKVKAREALDSKGQPTLQTDIHCLVKNVDKVRPQIRCTILKFGIIVFQILPDIH